jgi:hypothetical protein
MSEPIEARNASPNVGGNDVEMRRPAEDLPPEQRFAFNMVDTPQGSTVITIGVSKQFKRDVKRTVVYIVGAAVTFQTLKAFLAFVMFKTMG